MKILYNGNEYLKLENLTFNSVVDVVNNNLPINEFSVDITTNDNFVCGEYVELKDDSNTLWAKYIISDFIKIYENKKRIIAKSALSLLDKVILPAVKYNGTSADYVIDTLFDAAETKYGYLIHYTHPEISSYYINGFCPEQTARERLQWICFVIGVYVKTSFNVVNDYIEIIPIDTQDETIPESKIFWKPEYNYNEYVTGIKIKSYAFNEGTPSTTDNWVTDGTKNYIVTETEYSLNNVNAPATAQENIITVSGITLVNANNYSEILTRLAGYWFNRITVTGDIINNGEYQPGKVYNVSTGDEVFTGVFSSVNFRFGNASMSSVVIKQANEIQSSILVLNYTYNNAILRTNTYRFIVGYNYNIPTIYIDETNENTGVRYIYMPTNVSVTGTKTASTETIDEPMIIALQDENTVITINAVDNALAAGEVIRIV